MLLAAMSKLNMASTFSRLSHIGLFCMSRSPKSNVCLDPFAEIDDRSVCDNVTTSHQDKDP